MKKLFFFAYLILFTSALTALGQSTTILPGILLPQMTTAQRTAIASPQNGMLVFDTNTQSYWFRQSGTWVNLSAGGSSYWQLAGAGGNEIQNTNTGGFWSANPTGLTDESNNTTNPPSAPISGAGTRLMWIPSRSAFRVGTVEGWPWSGYWDAANIGLFSFATGYNIRASGRASTAMGSSTTASGFASTAIGHGTTASGFASTAMGYYTTASGDLSTAMGSAVTNNQPGSFIVGDNDPRNQGTTHVGLSNQFVARFANGYYLMTCGNTGNGYPTSDNVRTGIWAGTGANAWSAISDSTKKEKHQPIDGEGLLHKIAQFKLTT